MSTHTRRRLKVNALVYVIAFLASAHIAVPLYIGSSFIARLVGEQLTGLVYTGASVVSIFFFVALPRVLKKIGNYRALVATILLVAGMLVLVLAFGLPIVVIPAFILYLALSRIISFHYDVFLEDASQNASTGGVRGLYLTALNLGILTGPLLGGILVDSGTFERAYLFSLILLVPILLFSMWNYRSFEDPEYNLVHIGRALKDALRKKRIFKICVTNLLLFMFFSWMVVYLPLYLNRDVGFAWSTIGVILTITLLPFVFFDFLWGRLADTRFGEKEMLVVGFIVMAASSALLSFLETETAALWAAALFVTRVGASLVETMNETYFFKQIDSTDAPLLSVYRMTRPLGYILGPVIATVALFFVETQYLFLILGVLMLAGLYYSATLRDTAPHPLGWRARRSKHMHHARAKRG